MSSPLYLVCHTTRQVVHVAESGGGGGWFRGADSSVLVGAFCEAHGGKELVVMGAEGVDRAGGFHNRQNGGEFDPYDEWEPHTFEALLRKAMGHGESTDNLVRSIQKTLSGT